MWREGVDISGSRREGGSDMASGARIAPLERVNSPVPFCPKTLLRKKPAGEKGAAGRCPRAGSPQSLRQGLWIVDRDPVCLHFVHVLGRGGLPVHLDQLEAIDGRGVVRDGALEARAARDQRIVGARV